MRFMIKPPKWLWFLDLTVGVVFVSGIASFIAWRRSEDFRKSTFSRVPRIADYFYRVCFLLFISLFVTLSFEIFNFFINDNRSFKI